MHAHIVALPGDGIGPEVTDAALETLAVVARCHGHSFHVVEALIGGAAIVLLPKREQRVSAA